VEACGQDYEHHSLSGLLLLVLKIKEKESKTKINTEAKDWKNCNAQGRTWEKIYKKQLWENKDI